MPQIRSASHHQSASCRKNRTILSSQQDASAPTAQIPFTDNTVPPVVLYLLAPPVQQNAEELGRSSEAKRNHVPFYRPGSSVGCSRR